MKYVPVFLVDNSSESNKLIISKVNEVYMHIKCETAIRHELYEFFSFFPPGYKFMPSFKSGMWDGKVRIFNSRNNQLYLGLLSYVEYFAKERGYVIEYVDDINVATNFSVAEAQEFISTLKLPSVIEPRDYQVDSFVHCVRQNRALLLSPTGSGKSLIIYLLIKWYGIKTLVVVPTISLVTQMKNDFLEYGMDENDIHTISAGKEKESDSILTISTWQSLMKVQKNVLEPYGLVIGDEAHLFAADMLTTIMTKLDKCRYRFGTTGTISEAKASKLVLEGLFGPVKQFVKTKELIDSKYLSSFSIKSIVLKYPSQECKLISKATYQEELDYIVKHKKRNKFITNLALSLEGNSLVLFQFVEKHGEVLHKMILDKAKEGRKVFFVHGGVDAEDREAVRAITEKEKDAIIVASTGVFSVGINIKNLHNVIFSSPSKARIKNLQSIGRVLRLGDNKSAATLFDIADDLVNGKRVNYTLRHFIERIKIYAEEEFEYRIYNVKI